MAGEVEAKEKRRRSRRTRTKRSKTGDASDASSVSGSAADSEGGVTPTPTPSADDNASQDRAAGVGEGSIATSADAAQDSAAPESAGVSAVGGGEEESAAVRADADQANTAAESSVATAVTEGAAGADKEAATCTADAGEQSAPGQEDAEAEGRVATAAAAGTDKETAVCTDGAGEESAPDQEDAAAESRVATAATAAAASATGADKETAACSAGAEDGTNENFDDGSEDNQSEGEDADEPEEEDPDDEEKAPIPTKSSAAPNAASKTATLAARSALMPGSRSSGDEEKNDEGEGADEEATSEEEAATVRKAKVTKWKRLSQKPPDWRKAAGLSKDYHVVDRIVDILGDDTRIPLYAVQWVDGSIGHLRREDFRHFEAFENDVRMIREWKKSKLSREIFFSHHKEGRAYVQRRRKEKRAHGDDGSDMWCAFKAVGTALEILTGKNFVSKEVIEEFVRAGQKRRPGIKEFLGTGWVALQAFILKVCKEIDVSEMKRNRHNSGHTGAMRLAEMGLEEGVYLLAGFPKVGRGHCVVLEVCDSQDTSWWNVHDGEEELRFRDLHWLDKISFVRRLKLQGRK